MKDKYNPFIVRGYIDEYHFCDRVAETNKLIKNLLNQSNTTLYSLRKIGKTGLIQHVFSTLQHKKESYCIYVDLYATQSMHDFTLLLAKAIYASFPPKKGLGKRFVDTFKSWRPRVSFDPLTGTPELTLDLAAHQTNEQNVAQLLQYLDGLDVPIALAFDEFQQIVHYPEKNVEALLRTTIQHLRNCTFIFAGSHATLMHQMFHTVQRPFYNSTTTMQLGTIPSEEYQLFINKIFADHGRTITSEAIRFTLEWTLGFTYHTQYLCHYLFALGKKQIDESYVRQAAAEVLQELEHTFYQYRNLITATQWDLLKAIAKEETVSQPYSQDFIQKHKLGNAASVKRSLEALLTKELMYEETIKEKSLYAVYDKFFLRWLQRLY